MYTIMIVDDELPARNMLDLLIDWKKYDFRVTAKAENGKKALALYRELKPDLIITDIQMPVMNGIHLIEEIRKENPRQCIIVLSCHESFSYAQQAIRLGVQDYLIKDMLTEEQLQKCILRTEELLKSQEDNRRDNHSFFVNRTPDETFQQAYPSYFSKAERRMDMLNDCILTGEYLKAKILIQKLYTSPFEGIVKYHFLSWVNDFIYHQIYNQCSKDEICPEEVFGGYAHMKEDLLLNNPPEECCQILCDWIENLEAQNNAHRPKDYSVRIKNVLKYIQENYYQDISLQSVADQFGIHKVHLARTFKSETGQTLNEYLNKTRIEKAKLLLSITDSKASEIAYTVGFNNPQNFYNVFKKYAGMSPNEYRNQIQK